jgi:hypothetical protein
MAVDNDEDSAISRKNKLIGEIEWERNHAHKSARRFEVLIEVAFWTSIVLGLASTVVGLWFQKGIASGIFAALATTIAALPKLGNFRPSANGWYAVRDTANKFRSRLVYGLPVEVTLDQVALIAREWTEARNELGTRMAQISSDTHN